MANTATPYYRGNPTVLTSEHYDRNDQGVWLKTSVWRGFNSELQKIAGQFQVGNKVNLQSDPSSPIGTLTVQYGFLLGNGQDAPIDKYEFDTEIINKDLGFSDLAQSMTAAGQRLLKAYRNAASQSEREDVLIDSQELNDTADRDPFDKLVQEVDRGVESVEVKTLILKRTRTMAVAFSYATELSIRQSFYSTSKLVALEAIPVDVAERLPDSPYTQPANSEWGWLPRLENKTFIGRGLVEEHNDWVFAAWSTNLYTYVS